MAPQSALMGNEGVSVRNAEALLSVHMERGKRYVQNVGAGHSARTEGPNGYARSVAGRRSVAMEGSNRSVRNAGVPHYAVTVGKNQNARIAVVHLFAVMEG